METVDTETDACTGADQTETSFASGTLIPHLGKDYHRILGFPSSYFRPHGHNVVWEGEQYIIEAKPVIFCFGSDLGSVQLPTSHAICVILQIKFYVWKKVSDLLYILLLFLVYAFLIYITNAEAFSGPRKYLDARVTFKLMSLL